MIAPAIRELAAELKMLGYHLTVETAATVAPEGIACDLASLSPKLLNSAPDRAAHPEWHKRHEATRWQPDVVRAWVDHTPTSSSSWSPRRPTSRRSRACSRNSTAKSRATRCCSCPKRVRSRRCAIALRGLVELCKARGFRYAHRLQIELWGNRRGV